MRCEWCGITVSSASVTESTPSSFCSVQTHSTCRSRAPEECGFGVLKDILIPPSAISIPRIADMNKDLILGIGNKQSKAMQIMLTLGSGDSSTGPGHSVTDLPENNSARPMGESSNPFDMSRSAVASTVSDRFTVLLRGASSMYVVVASPRSLNDLPKATERNSSRFVRRVQRQSSFVVPRKKATVSVNQRSFPRGTSKSSSPRGMSSTCFSLCLIPMPAFIDLRS